MNKCFVGVLRVWGTCIVHELCLCRNEYDDICITVTKDIVLMYDVACDADFYLTKRQIVLRVRDSEIQW